MADQISHYLTRFEHIVRMYRRWSEEQMDPLVLKSILLESLQGRYGNLRAEVLTAVPARVFDAYNLLTHHATHRMRSATTAFSLLERINTAFQKAYPVIEGEVVRPTIALPVAANG